VLGRRIFEYYVIMKERQLHLEKGEERRERKIAFILIRLDLI